MGGDHILIGETTLSLNVGPTLFFLGYFLKTIKQG